MEDESNEPESFSFEPYLAIISQKRWYLMLAFCLSVGVGCFLAVKLPKIYEATTMILVQPQRVPEKIVQPVIDSNIENRISSLSQQILSRSNLEKIIETFGLFSEPKEKDMLMEDKIESLRKRISVEVSRTSPRRDAESFSITYKDRVPSKAMKVANGLASFFIDENLRMREGQAVGTSDFLEAELEAARGRLEEKEQALKGYRQKNMGELPDQLQANLNLLDRLNAQLGQSQVSLRSAQVSLSAIETEDRTRQSILVSVAPSGTTAPLQEPDGQKSIAQLKDQLAALKSTYTEQHPDVVRLKTRIEQLEAAAASAPASASAQSASTPAQQPIQPGRSARPEIANQKALLEGTIRGLEAEIVRVRREIQEVQRKVDETPKRELELITLTRDYENIKTSYNSLLNRKLEADISVNMEKKQKGVQFQVIDAARLPEKPIFPDPKKLFLITIAAGLGLCGAIVFLAKLKDSSIHKVSDLEDVFGIAVLATIPRMFSRRDRIRNRVRHALTAVSIALSLALTTGFAVLVFDIKSLFF